MKHLIITGAYGLVGSNICKILEKDKDLIVHKIKFDDFSEIQDSYWGEQFCPLEQADYIIHCAGYGQPLKFVKDKIKTIEINTKTTNELFKFLKPDGKFLFVSTSEVYSGAKSPYSETDIGTTNPQHPRACYIEGKRCGEAICSAYRDQGYNVKIARLALAYGPGTKKHDTRVLNQFIEQALTTGEIKLMDKGEAIRTYCYVRDVAEMLLDILFEGTQPVYNVGGTSTVTIRELAEKIGMITGAKITLGKAGLKDAPEDVRLSLALTLTEFPRDFVSLDEGLIKTINYQKKIYGTK